MEKLSLKFFIVSFIIILTLSIMVTFALMAPPPGQGRTTPYWGEEAQKKTQETKEPQKAAPHSCPPFQSVPTSFPNGGTFDRGHWLILLAAMIFIGISYIFGEKGTEEKNL